MQSSVKQIPRHIRPILVGQQLSELNGALDEREGTLCKYEKLAPLRFLKKMDCYHWLNQRLAEVRTCPWSILDQTGNNYLIYYIRRFYGYERCRLKVLCIGRTNRSEEREEIA